jgi:urease accessory protein UreF
MLEKKKIAPSAAAEVTGELLELAEQLGSPDLTELAHTSAGLELNRVRNLGELRRFLQGYSTQMLVASELPTIFRAYQLASHSEVRELIELDQRLQRDPQLMNLARASQHVGRAQLKKLRSLRDQRIVQRYLAAVESGEAKAWHTIVFGLVLALYSLPLRQGLLHYGTQTLSGFIHSAAGRLELRQSDCEALLVEIAQPLPQAVDGVLSEESGALRLIKG